MLDARQYARVVKASALYDLIVTFPFATPWTLGVLVAILAAVDGALGLPGSIPAPTTLSVLFANLMGSVVIVWSVLRLHLGMNLLGRYDAVARFLFAAWQINALANGMSWILLPLLAIEIAFGIAQAVPVRQGDAD